ncbi:MAG: HNH endonuclease [Erysipelotrichaceae bacterium]|nr:HNH endonuclease [Erysipelotrichaceae bacterium]
MILIEKMQKEDERKRTKEYQRSLMSAGLRYDVMKRDGFRCVLCGRGADNGVKLHVDHILPVSKGGKTVMNNLRTLCSDCNLGKSDKYDESGDN